MRSDLAWPAILAEARVRRDPLAAIAAKHGVGERTVLCRPEKESEAGAAALQERPEDPQDGPNDDTPATPEQTPPHRRRLVDRSTVRRRFTCRHTVDRRRIYNFWLMQR